MTLDFNRMLLSNLFWAFSEGVDVSASYISSVSVANSGKEEFHSFDLASKNQLLVAWAARCTNNRAPFEVGLVHGNVSAYFSESVVVRTAVLAMLVQAYRLRASMEIHFAGPRSGQEDATVHTGFEPEIPESVREFASEFGVEFANKSKITDREGKELFVRMTLSPDEVEKIKKAKMNPLVVAFIVNRGTWTDNEFYAILNYCGEPRHVFDGDLPAIIGVPLEAVRRVLRSAQLAERLINDLQMELGDTQHGQDSIQFRWLSERTIEVTSFYSFEKKVLFGDALKIEANKPFIVGLYCGMKEDINFEFTFDDCFEDYQGCNVMYFSRDFGRIAPSVLATIQGFAAQNGIPLLAIKLSADEIDQHILDKIARSGNLAMEMEGTANG
jgi:hypothetical protein